MNIDDFESLARNRRTSLKMLSDEVDPEIVLRCASVGIWAPNHHRTWPLEVTSLVGAARGRFGDVLAKELPEGSANEARALKLRTKYLRAPAILLIWCRKPQNPETLHEDKLTVAAATQMILLSATSLGLATFWSSPPAVSSPEVLNDFAVSETSQLIGVVYVGWPLESVATPSRPELPFRVVDK
jgi:nitroreductase